MITRVSVGLAGLGITVLRPTGMVTDLLLTSEDPDHRHEATLLVPRRHFRSATTEWKKETEENFVFDIQQRDLRIVEMPRGKVEATRGLRKEIGGGKRQDVPTVLGDWRDVTWAVDFDHIEKSHTLKPGCLTSSPPKVVAARVHMTGGRLDAGLPRHVCLRKERWRVLDQTHGERDLQVVADTMYHVWDTDTSEVTILVERFDGELQAVISLAAAGGVIAGVIAQSRPVKDHDDEDCGKGVIHHYADLYGVMTANPGSITLADVDHPGETPGFRVDENKRCGRGLISER